MKIGDIAVVLEGCSKLEAGAKVVVLHYSIATGEFWCRSYVGQACYWIKAELLEVAS